MPFLKVIFPVLLSLCVVCARAQLTVTGRVLDQGRHNLVENVLVFSTGGQSRITDSLGRYEIEATRDDSLYFVFEGKATPKYPVRTIADLRQFDIAIKRDIPGRYTTLSEVVVTSRSFRQDSLENREQYAKAFNYRKPGIYIAPPTPGEAMGLDLDQLVNTFRFKRNRQLSRFQSWLRYSEEEKYVSYRFNANLVRGLTGLNGAALDSFMKWNRPAYEDVAAMSDWQLGEYILASFKRQRTIPNSTPMLRKEE